MRKILLRIWHEFFGHPKSAIMWSESKAECTLCGAVIHHADFYPFM